MPEPRTSAHDPVRPPGPAQAQTRPATRTSRRHEVLDLIAGADDLITCREVAARLGAPVSSVRFHLDGLVEQGLSTCTTIPSQGRGRPALGYRITPAGTAELHRGQARIAPVLVEALELAGGQQASIEAGRRWGCQLAREAASAGEAIDPTAALGGMLARQGFEPTRRSTRSGDAGQRVFELTSCPFLQLAQRHPDVVCALHGGAVEGFLEELGDHAPVRLEPFASPHTCRVVLG